MNQDTHAPLFLLERPLFFFLYNPWMLRSFLVYTSNYILTKKHFLNNSFMTLIIRAFADLIWSFDVFGPACPQADFQIPTSFFLDLPMWACPGEGYRQNHRDRKNLCMLNYGDNEGWYGGDSLARSCSWRSANDITDWRRKNSVLATLFNLPSLKMHLYRWSWCSGRLFYKTWYPWWISTHATISHLATLNLLWSSLFVIQRVSPNQSMRI
jgi:hypothetical protein